MSEVQTVGRNPFSGRRELCLPRVPYPHVPAHTELVVEKKLRLCQAFIEKMEYNFTGVNYFTVNKFRSLSRILQTGKEIATECLPIKCREAFFLALYLTQDIRSVERLPLSFKSEMDGHIHRHIVCLVMSTDQKRFGTLGLSRRRELGYKELGRKVQPVTVPQSLHLTLCYQMLSDVIRDFQTSYLLNFHKLRQVKIGLPISHDWNSEEPICWKCLSLDFKKHSQDDIEAVLENFPRIINSLYQRWRDNDFETSKKIKKMICQPLHERKKKVA